MREQAKRGTGLPTGRGRRARHGRTCSPRSPLTTLVRRVASIAALVADRPLRARDRPLPRARPPRRCIRDPKPILWNLLWDSRDRLAAVPDPAAAARLLAQPPLRAARAARGRGPDRPVGAARRRARARVRARHRPALHDLRALRRRGDLRRGADQPLPLELRDRDRRRAALGRRPAPRAARRRLRPGRARPRRRSARAAAGSTTSSSGEVRPGPGAARRA